MSGTTSFSVRMDKDVKQQSEDIFRNLGVNMTTAINIFLRQAIQAGGFPFEIRQKSPNYQTQMALAEAERLLADPDAKRYSDVEEALKELKIMSYQIQWTSRFKKDYKQAIRRGLPIEELDDVIRLLAAGEALPKALKDHALTGNWLGHRECHIRPDWLLIYKISSNQIELSLTRTGTHSDLLQ